MDKDLFGLDVPATARIKRLIISGHEVLAVGGVAITLLPDVQLTEATKRFARAAVAVVADFFGVTLDWSEGSIEQIESFLARLHDEKDQPAPDSGEDLAFLAKVFGSYCGEVIRRHHGGQFVMVTIGEESTPAVQLGLRLWYPWKPGRTSESWMALSTTSGSRTRC